MAEFGDIDESITTKFTVDTAAAVEEARKLREQVEALKNTMKTVASETGETTQVIAQSVLSTTTGMAKGAGSIAKSEYGKVASAASGLTSTLGTLGSVGKFVFGSVLGLSAVKVLRDLVNYFKEAVQYGYEFSKSIFQLQVGINAIRRTGVEITIQDVYDNLDKLQAKFGIFSRKELVEGSSQLINLTRDFGFTKDKIFELQDAIATLAVVNGRAMDDVQRTVALAISSGYTEGLQRLGVSINRVTIALEAQRLGYGRNYMSLTEQQRAQATYNLILQKTKKYQDDLEEYQKTAPGRIDKAKVAFTNLATTVGEQVIPVWADFVEWLGKSAEALDENIKKIKELQQQGVYGYGPRYGAGQYVMPGAKVEKELIPTIETGFIKNQIEEYKRMENELPPIAEEVADKITDIDKNFADNNTELWDEYLQDKEDLLQQYNEKAEDIERQYTQKLEDLNLGLIRDNEDAWRGYYDDLEDINIQYNQDVADANAEYQQDILDNEEDFQRKMRDLRQKFLYSLEDAIRERDAKQAMLLIRQYNFDKQQAQQNRDDDLKDLKRKHKEELEELKRQKDRRIAELNNELQRKLADIQAEYQRELDELYIWKTREYEDREIWYAREQQQAWNNYQRRRADALTQYNKDLDDLARYLKAKYNYNKIWMDALYKYTESIIGENGSLTALWKYFYAIQSMAVNPSLTPAQEFHWGGSYASGGSLTVSKPTLALFGEKGTETATFSPGAKTSGAKGELAIKLYLSDDLRAEIVEDALGEFNDAIVHIERIQR